MRLRRALGDSEQKHPLLAIGAVNALAAHVAAETGFDALWVSGLEVSAASGLPDANVLGSRDLADVVASLGRVTDLPVIVDIDNAGGSGRTAERFAYDLMCAGAAAVCVEDSAYPKCSSFAVHRAQTLADRDLLCEQVGRIRKLAGDGLVVVARTEALIAGEDMGGPPALVGLVVGGMSSNRRNSPWKVSAPSHRARHSATVSSRRAKRLSHGSSDSV
ncbi:MULTISPECIES: isocitrate lyase/PEP mutase family protein [Streptomyces]